MMFSATMPAPIRELANTLLHNPAVVHVAPVVTTAEGIDESVYFVEKRNKPQLLAHLVNELPMSRAIVFTRTKHGADKVVRHLHARGIRAEAIHGNKSQNARQRALENFRASKIPLLIATDIASRGIDIDDVSHVVNYDLTHEPETYVHRIGRTARAGASGVAVSFCAADERPNLKAIERLIRRSIAVKRDHPNYVSAPEMAGEGPHNSARPAPSPAHSHPRAHSHHRVATVHAPGHPQQRAAHSSAHRPAAAAAHGDRRVGAGASWSSGAVHHGPAGRKGAKRASARRRGNRRFRQR
jgi:ATP-dependent RNA helicase RhlE